MALQKQNYNLAFSKGLDTKTDPLNVGPDKFLLLENAQFRNGFGLEKRNGFGNLTKLTNVAGTTITTLNDNLVATGSILQAYSADNDTWINRGSIQPVDLQTKSIVRASTSQTAPDCAIASNGIMCTVFLDAGVGSYVISDSVTGQTIVSKTQLHSTATNPRVYLLGQNFIILFGAVISSTPQIQYIVVPVLKPTSPSAATTFTSVFKSSTAGYDAIVANNSLYVAWKASDSGDAIRVAYLSKSLVLSAAVVFSSQVADLISLAVDNTASLPIIYLAYQNATTNNGYVIALNPNLTTAHASTQIITSTIISHLAASTTAGMCTVLYDVVNNYSYTSVRSDYICKVSISQAGSVGTTSTVIRGVGLASKVFADVDGTQYVMVAYDGSYQPTYFIIDLSGNITCKIAYSNGGGYAPTQVLCNVNLIDNVICLPYTIKDLLVSVNKAQAATTTAGIFTQTGINLAKLTINSSAQYSSEIAQCLHLTGGIMWQYDAVKPVELGFHVWPDTITATVVHSGGSMTSQQYYYQFCYEWTDAQGNLHRSAPSLPISCLVDTGSNNSVTLKVPTLRVTYKDSTNPVRIVGYRWSVAQQNYYQFTSLTSPTLNDTTVDNVTITDTLADSSILGNSLIYTTGGVIENIAPPAFSSTALYKSRLFGVSAEDRNLLWYSKQVIQNTPVEMSDLFTIYVAPTSGAQGSTGPITAIAAMDDKLIIFKANAIYYLTGTGPDNTGAQNDFSEPTFISGAVGTSNPKSIVYTPNGLMFQSDKGIWELGRNLATTYIGADVESYNNDPITSALTIPGATEVRFTTTSGAMLMHNNYYNQLGKYTNVANVSSTLYNNKHTFLMSTGQIRQETKNVYLDGTAPVLPKFSTAWLKLTVLQGFQRVYFFYLLNEYYTPYKLNVEIAYDYNPAILQSTMLEPGNSRTTWGSENLWGGGEVWGGNGPIDQKRVFLDRQKCQSIQVTISEIYDVSKGVAAGQGVSIAGINFVIGAKDNKPKLAGSQSSS